MLCNEMCRDDLKRKHGMFFSLVLVKSCCFATPEATKSYTKYTLFAA